MGTPLGRNIFKIRLKISSKGRGKSGGARVISLVEEAMVIGEVSAEEEELTVNLITLYDKADTAVIDDKELKRLVKALHSED